jgi:hypothetical protein
MEAMNNHLNQAIRNEELHAVLLANEPNRFFDWKIVALFYAAFNYLKALSFKKNLNIGETQTEMANNCNPDIPKPIMPISREAWQQYNDLMNFSKEARNNETNEEMRKDYEACLFLLDGFKTYVRSQGLPILLAPVKIPEQATTA